jgi:anaerobic magnesium-protoporphyrin IX monomethyl ester cyclase
MKIAFDGTTLQPRRTGVGYYTEHLLHHVAAQVDAGDLVLVSNREPDLTRPLPIGVSVAASGASLVRLVWMQTMAPWLIRRVRADVVHFTNGMMPLLSFIPTVVTIHDMSLALYPETHPWRRLLLNWPLVKRAAHRAAAIITPSHSAKHDIVRVCGVDPARVHVVHEAAAPVFHPVTDQARLDALRRRYTLPARFVLCVGAIEPRKNLPRLFEAFAQRRRSGALRHDLVCVGPYGWLSRDLGERVKNLGIQDAVHFAGYVPIEDLAGIYSLADMFACLSLYEGFGLPALEAMACGTPVIAGDSGSVAEVTGGAAELVNPLDVEAIGAALVRVGNDDELRRSLGERGLRKAAEYSWDRAARETLAVYRSVVPAHAGERTVIGTPIAKQQAAIDVLVGQAYYLRFDPKLWEAQQPYPPLGALYAAAALRERGHDVRVFDAMVAESEDEWALALDRERPRIAVLYEDNFNYLTKMCLLRMRAAAETMIRAARTRGIPVVVAGSDATDHPEVYLDAGAACVLIGEGEITLTEVVRALRKDSANMETLAGVCWRDGSGQLHRGPARPPVRDLDTLPRPAWDLVDVSRYRRAWLSSHGYFSMHLSTTRGCPYHCNWCAKPLYGQRYAVRTPSAVAEEIAWMYGEYKPDHLWITDDIFGLQPGWVEQFADALEERSAKVPFKCLMRADQVTPPVVRALRRAGCRTVWLGAESGSQRVLDAMDKGLRVAQVDEACGLLHAAEIEVGLFLQFGYPGETRADIGETLAMVQRCRPDDIGISVSYPLPGTPFHERVRAQLGLKQNWTDSDDLTPMYRATYSDEFYRVLHRAAHAQFRLDKAARLKWLLRHPWQLRPSHARLAISALKYAGQLPALKWRLNRLANSRDRSAAAGAAT